MKHKFLITTVAAAVFSLGSCSLFEVDDIQDLNNPTVESVLANASRVQINQLGVGLQSAMRNGYFDVSSFGGSIGREGIVFARTDNRFYTELQGQVDIDPGGIFYGWYINTTSTRRRAEIFARSAANTNQLSDLEKKACLGFARTVQAYVTLNCLNMLGQVGIRTQFDDLLSEGDLLKPGPFVSYDEGLRYCKQLVDEGATALDGGGTAFPFTVTSGWAGFSTPADFKKFNRAVAARVAMYQKDWTGMSAALSASFLDLNGSLATGPKFTYSTTAGDIVNPFFQPRNEPGRPTAVQNAFITDAEKGDTRVEGNSTIDGGVAKVRKRSASASLGGYPETLYEMQLVPTNTSPLSIIRNEELVLMYAEAQAQQNGLANAVTALDKIRTAHGLQPLATAKPTIVNNKDGLIDEVLNQRRYSLFMEGSHRWFDMRRYNRLTALPKDLATHRVWSNFPKPQNEIDWDSRPQ